jgi:hypothetical protein
MRDLILALSDIHFNATTGLCPPTITLDDEGEYHASKFQLWLWECWQKLLAEFERRSKEADRVFGFVNGDGPDKNKHDGYQLITLNEAIIVRGFTDLVKPACEQCKDGFWIIRGTLAHVGGSGYLEELAAQALQATRYPEDSQTWSCWFLKLLLQDRLIDVSHHGKTGNLPHTRANSAGNVVNETIDQYIRDGETKMPDLIVRGHRHLWVDSGTNYVARQVQLPCWQLPTSHSHQVAPRRRADYGAAFITITDGRIDVEPVLYRPKAERAWQPANQSTSPSKTSSRPSSQSKQPRRSRREPSPSKN